MTHTVHLDTITDPLVTPVLALMQAAVNYELSDVDGFDSTEAIKHIEHRPMQLELAGQKQLPELTCFRFQSRASQKTFVYLDHITTLRFGYMTPSCAVKELHERWPLLDRVWRVMLTTLLNGRHDAYLDGAPVLEDAGVVWINPASVRKVELWADNGKGFAFPAFVADIEVTWRDLASTATPDDAYPFLGALGDLYVDGGVGDADVRVESLTELGREARDAEPYEEESELEAYPQ